MSALPAHGTRNRGVLRGFFVLCLCFCALAACDRKQPKGAGSSEAKTDDAGGAESAADAAVDSSATEQDVPTTVEAPAEPIRVPWTTPPRELKALRTAFPDTPVGTLSGEIFGTDRPVRHIIRAQCGAGSVLQAVYEDAEGTLRVTPGMAVRFFGLQTGHPATYSEGDFGLTVDFDHDTPERLAGHLRITYQERGLEKVYADLKVDGAPTTMLLPPRVEGKGRMPLFEQCFPNGYFRAVEEDGTEHHGLLHVTDVKGKGAPLARPLFGEGTGLRIFVLPPKPNKAVETEAPLELAEARQPGTRPAAVLIEAFRVPELTAPSQAQSGNIGEEKTVQVHEGTAQFEVGREGGAPRLTMVLRDVKIPMLLDGPLHGKTFSVIEIDAHPTPPGEVATTPGPTPSWWPNDED